MEGFSTKPWLPPQSSVEFTYINANLVDPASGQVHPNSSFTVKNGSFARVSKGTSAPASSTDASHSECIDLQSRFVCPGLIDCHVHLTATPGALKLKEMHDAAPGALVLRSAYTARKMLLRGFTTVRDTGGADAALRDAIADGLTPGPRLFIAGKALSQTGGHGDFRATHQGPSAKCCGGHGPSLARVCDGVPQCLEAARDELRQGADFVKIMCGGGVATPSDALEMIQFTPEEVTAITRTASYSGTYVTAHAYTNEAIRHAVDNGCRGIEHANFINTETAAYCASKGVTVTPTLVTYYGYTLKPFDSFLDEFGQEKNRSVLASGLEALTILQEAKVKTCFGSDLIGGLHLIQNREFGIRAKVLSAKAILQSATINAAEYVGKAGKLGIIEDAALADFLVLDKNPLDDITSLDNAEDFYAIVKEGRVVNCKGKDMPVDTLYRDMYP